MNILAHHSYPYESVNPHIPDATVQVRGDHRFQGYPNGMMESPRIPATNTVKRLIQPSIVPGAQSNHYPSNQPAPPPPAFDEKSAQSMRDKENFSLSSHHEAMRQKEEEDRAKEREQLMHQLNQKEQQRQLQQYNQQVQKSREQSKYTKDQLDQILTKRYDLHQLQSYDPWGKPGNGAPTTNHHKQKFMEEDIKPDMTDSNVGGLTFHTPGGGAPLRTSSGRLKTEVPGDQDIRYHTGNRGRDLTESFRYKKDQETIRRYRADLDNIQRERAANDERQRLTEMRADLQTLQSDIYGRPGAGAPNRMANYGSMNSAKRYRDVFRYLRVPEDTVYDPWGKGVGVPQRDPDGNVQRYRFHNKTEGNMVHPDDLTDTHRERIYPKQTTLGIGPNIGHGAPLQNEYGEKITRLNATMDRRDGGMSVQDTIPGRPRNPFDENDNIFHPFGTPGGGNPNFDKDGNRIAIIPGPSTVNEPKSDVTRDTEEERKKAIAANELNRELQKGIIEQELKRKHENQTIRSPTDGIADRMLIAQAGKPRRDPSTGQLVGQHLGSTDVTELSNISPRLGIPHTYKYGNPTSYYTDLERQVEERKLRNMLQKRQDVQEARLHHESFYKSLGHNAPEPNLLKKQNLTRNLYHPDGMKNEYKKSVLHNIPVANTNYVKNNIKSSHVTAYEVQNDFGDVSYAIRAPYANF